jgi:hypothetical protein
LKGTYSTKIPQHGAKKIEDKQKMREKPIKGNQAEGKEIILVL